MKSKEHQWAFFYSPRNGRIGIEACRVCGVAKSLWNGHKSCSKTSKEKRDFRLRGWTEAAEKNVANEVESLFLEVQSK